MKDTRAFAFGPYRLSPARHSLMRGETRIRIGGRALDLLTALVESAGDVVSKQELMARAWPTTTVDESNLKVNVAALRRLLGDDVTDAKYIATMAGRGYRFIAPVQSIPPSIFPTVPAVEAAPAEGAAPSPTTVAGIVAVAPWGQARVMEIGPGESLACATRVEELCGALGQGTVLEGSMLLRFGDTLLVLKPGSMIVRQDGDQHPQHLSGGVCRVLFCRAGF